MGVGLSVLMALAAMLSWGIGDFFIQKTVRKFGDLETLAFIGIIGSIALLPFVINDFDVFFSLPNVLFLAFIGVVVFITSLFNFEALKKGKLSVVEVLLEAELPITLVLGIMLFNEKVSGAQLGMMGLIFAGVVLMAYKSNKKFFSLEKGVFLALVAAVGFALVNYLTALSSIEFSPFIAIWSQWVVFSILCLIIISKKQRIMKMFRDAKDIKILVFTIGIIDTLAWVFYALALSSGSLVITTAITEAYPAIGIMLGFMVNKERIMKHQYLGALFAILASVGLAFFFS